MKHKNNSQQKYINCNILVPNDIGNKFYYNNKERKNEKTNENISLNTDSILYITTPITDYVYIQKQGGGSTYTTWELSFFSFKLNNNDKLYLIKEEFEKFKNIING